MRYPQVKAGVSSSIFLSRRRKLLSNSRPLLMTVVVLLFCFQSRLTSGRSARKLSKEELMSVIDEVLKANETYAQHFNADLDRSPSPKLVIVTCMDLRLTNTTHILGLEPGDADIIRNVGS